VVDARADDAARALATLDGGLVSPISEEQENGTELKADARTEQPTSSGDGKGHNKANQTRSSKRLEDKSRRASLGQSSVEEEDTSTDEQTSSPEDDDSDEWDGSNKRWAWTNGMELEIGPDQAHVQTFDSLKVRQHIAPLIYRLVFIFLLRRHPFTSLRTPGPRMCITLATACSTGH
jgi:hypothetical protein